MEEELVKPKDGDQFQTELFPELVSEYQDGRDELNLAEFPISAIGSRFDPNQKTLKFEDRSFDKATGEMIDRQLTITASDEYGLPTAADDEVLLGLLQMSRLQKFDSPTVSFSSYQILRILGWQFSTYNYRRVRDAINRWLGVTLYYKNAWRDKKTGQWVDANFHFIEFVEFHKPGKESAIAPDGHSVIKWNDLVFRNFKAGNLKTLDFHLYRALKSGIAKRLFRFLDKRFYHRSRLSFSLEAFACEKIGLTRPIKVTTNGKTLVDVAQIKRRLLPAITELEEQQFIAKRDPEKRFTKDSGGVWQVHFERYVDSAAEPQQKLDIEIDDVSVMEGRLIGHGVTKAQARRLVSEFDDPRVEMQLDALEFLLAKGEGAPQNRAGWLVKAIMENYGPPRGFKTRAQLEQEAKEKAERLRAKEEARRQQLIHQRSKSEEEEAEYRERDRRVEAYLAALDSKKRQELEDTAVRESGLLGRTPGIFRKTAIFAYVWKIIEQQDQIADEE